MHLILSGATGLVGSGVLDAMIRAKDVTKISILSRRPVKMADDIKDPRVNVIIHSDFSKYEPALLDQLRGAAGCVWALGISQTKVDADEYVKITKDYTLAAARSFAGLSGKPDAPFRFVYVSGAGATQTPGFFSPIFARVKGETEQALADMTAEMPTLLQADSPRPAAVDGSQNQATKGYVPKQSFMERCTTTVLLPPIRVFYKGMHSPTDILGDFLTQLAMGRMADSKLQGPGASKLGPSWILENVAIRRAMGVQGRVP